MSTDNLQVTRFSVFYCNKLCFTSVGDDTLINEGKFLAYIHMSQKNNTAYEEQPVYFFLSKFEFSFLKCTINYLIIH